MAGEKDPTTQGAMKPFVAAGEVIAYRLFDISYAIDLDRAETILGQLPGRTRKRLTATPPKAVAYDVPPLVLALDPVPLTIGSKLVAATVTARLYDFGVLSLALSIPARNLGWAELIELVNAFNALVGPGFGEAIWSRLTGQIRKDLAGALIRPTASTLEEDYIIAMVRSFDRPMTATQIQAELDLVPLLSGERLPLSEGARKELLRNCFSYYTDDMVALTWDRAFIFEPRADSDVVDVLEVANAQLLEMRYYDELLDAELPRMYEHVQTTRRAGRLLASHQFAELARRLYTLVAEVTELTEKVDNALQVTEDVYLARVYAAALDVFRIRPVSVAVDRKLAIIRDTYAALYDEASGGRTTLLEVAVVVLIIVEIVIAVWR